MQRLLGGSLESPALKGTVYPKDAAPKARDPLQASDVGSIRVETGGLQSLASLCAPAGAMKREASKDFCAQASHSSFARMLAKAHLEQAL